jgi:hypothetical protein
LVTCFAADLTSIACDWGWWPSVSLPNRSEGGETSGVVFPFGGGGGSSLPVLFWPLAGVPVNTMTGRVSVLWWQPRRPCADSKSGSRADEPRCSERGTASGVARVGAAMRLHTAGLDALSATAMTLVPGRP